MLHAVGIDATVETMPKSVYFTRMRAGRVPDVHAGMGQRAGEIRDRLLRAVLVTKDEAVGFGSWNGGFSDPDADVQLKAAEQIMDSEGRGAELAKASRMFMDAHAIVPLHAQNVIMGLRDELGYTTMPDEAFRAQNLTE